MSMLIRMIEIVCCFVANLQLSSVVEYSANCTALETFEFLFGNPKFPAFALYQTENWMYLAFTISVLLFLFS